MKRGTWSFQQQWKECGIGLGLLLGLTASADMSSVCVSCQIPSGSAVEALGLASQIPGLGNEFGSYRAGFGVVPSQPAFQLPSLWSLSGGASPPSTPSWLDRVQSGYLPQNFSLSPRPLVSPDSFVWKWNAYPDGFNPYASLVSLWNIPLASWHPAGVSPSSAPALAALSASAVR